jgi:putative ABC transport system permease protein
LFTAGVVAVGAGIDPNADEVLPLLFIPGIIAVVASTLLVGAPVLRAVARVSVRLPVGPRLAIRDLSRFETRSSAALGAITLGLGIAVMVVLIAAAKVPNADEGNLAADQLAVWTAAPSDFGGLQLPEPSPDDEQRQEGALAEIADRAGAEAIVPLDVAADGSTPEVRGGQRLLNTAVLGLPVNENTVRDSGRFFVATPELTDYLGIDLDGLDEDTFVLTLESGPVFVAGDLPIPALGRDAVPSESVVRIDVRDYSSGPRALLTEAGLAETGLEPVRAGWLLDLPGPVAPTTLADLRDFADDAGFVIEDRDNEGGLTTVRTAATAIGVLLALSILALTVGLLRSDASRDLRTLGACGATRRIRRSITATTCAVLATVGVGLGTVTAYIVLVVGYWPEADRLGTIPVAHLAVLLLGLPVVATAMAWLVGGNERADMARTAD